jgi:hypothetical protein
VYKFGDCPEVERDRTTTWGNVVRSVLLLTETALTVLAVVLSVTVVGLGSSWFERIEAVFRSVARRRSLAVLIVVVSALAARTIALPILPTPKPHVDDEYSHLLLADTLLHGRLANITHPMWVHFVTFEVNMKPTYASVYQPVQGIFLATGKLLTGQPFAGVMLSVALMCGAICWMLQGWIPAEWALLGGLIAIARFGVFTYWADSYMGGAPAAIGGALALGALGRIRNGPRTRDAVVMGLGFAVLANSRPYEGFILSLVCGLTFLFWLFKQRGTELRTTLARIVAPLAIVLALTGLATMYYVWRVTGNPLHAPYQVAWETYGMMPKYLWQPLKPHQAAALRHEALAYFYYVWEFAAYARTRSVHGLLFEWGRRLLLNWLFYLGPILTLPMLAAVATAPYGFSWKRFDPSTRLFFLCATGVVVGLSVEVFSYPHYAAPITCVVIALVLSAMRQLRRQVYRGKPFGLFLTRVVPVLCLLLLAVRAAAVPLHIQMTQSVLPLIYNSVREDNPAYSIRARLEKMPGQHLVIVQYPPGSENWMGWVHNEADIDDSKIVWAWDMGTDKNRELIEYFRGRHAWIVNSADDPPDLQPYAKYPNR